MQRLKPYMLCALILFITTGLPLRAENGTDQPAKLMIILDASGSMWGRMEGRTKIEIARDVLAEVIRELPDGTQVGLVAYGHRVKGDCNDVEELVPLAPLNKETFVATLNRLDPKGMTPMLDAISQTVERLKSETGSTTVLLVSDGKETCADNPCDGISKLKTGNVQFVLHIIGFNVTPEEKEQLTCMAQAGGGVYFSADDTAGLKNALTQVRESVSVGTGAGKLVLNKASFAPRESIPVDFEAKADYADNAWIGIVPDTVPHGQEVVADKHDLAYQYLRRKTTGTLTFTAPAEPGSYNMRMFNTDSVGVETASVPFTVTNPDSLGSIQLDRTEYAAYDPVQVTFEAQNWYKDNAWIGIIPSNIPHGKEVDSDGNYVVYEYCRSHPDGKVTFTAPSELGSYDVRMFDTDDRGKETASVTFQVNRELTGVELKLGKTVFAPGEEIILTFKAPPTLPRNAWIGIIPSDIPHGSEATNDKHEIDYEYIGNQANGTMKFKAPDKPGQYDFRMNDTDTNGKELTHISFTVR